MSRYIDADLLEEKIDVADAYMNGIYEKLEFVKYEDIRETPTVDVIPTKLVEQYAQDLINMGNYTQSILGKELLKIIDNWRKENETDANAEG